MFWQDDRKAARFVIVPQLVSSDAYWFTDPGICGAYEGGHLLNGDKALSDSQCRRAANYGYTVDRMRVLDALDGKRKPIWNVVELGHPFTEDSAPTITGAQIPRRRVALVHRRRPRCPLLQPLLRRFLRLPARAAGYGAAVRPTVKAVNAQVRSLAPVLNAPTVMSGVSNGAGVRALTKWSGGHFYVIAGSTGSAVTGTFSLPCAGDATATVLDEGRTVPVRAGSFGDPLRRRQRGAPLPHRRRVDVRAGAVIDGWPLRRSRAR